MSRDIVPSESALSESPTPPFLLRGAGCLATARTLSAGTLVSLIWVAFKVSALSYGGGFVIIPLMQNDAVNHYH
jgi:chromate transporter